MSPLASQSSCHSIPSTKSWEQAEEELGGAGFSDARLDSRAVDFLATLMASPLASIPEACEVWSSTKGAYRLLSNPKMQPSIVIKRHRQKVIERSREEPVLLAIGDTSYLDLSHLDDVAGLGPLTSKNTRGLFLHPTMIATPQGIPLGVIDNYTWARDEENFGRDKAEERLKKSIDEKESRKWLESLKAAEEFQDEVVDSCVISVFDREGDNYDVLMTAADSSRRSEFVIRSQHNRKLESSERRLHDFLEGQEIAGCVGIDVPRRPRRKGLSRSKGQALKKDKGAVPAMKARTTELSISFGEVTLKPSPRKTENSSDRKPISLYAVYARELDEPEQGERIRWVLLTSIKIKSFDDALKIVEYYQRRWMIELLFRVLKSGCKIEETQLRKAERIERLLAFDMIVSWYILYLTTHGREVPDLPCNVVFEDDQWKALWVYHHRNTELPNTPPSLQQATRMVGMLGSYLGRKSDGEPGMKSLWVGLSRLADIAAMWLICGQERELGG